MVQYPTMSSLQIASTIHHTTLGYNDNSLTCNNENSIRPPLVPGTGDVFMAQLEKRATSPVLTTEKLKELYLETLTPKEHKAYLIAKNHLGMSFTLEKSVGFLEWKKKTFVSGDSA
jgi:hypothetical protein